MRVQTLEPVAGIAKVLRTVDPQTMLLAGNNISENDSYWIPAGNQSFCQRDELMAASVDFFDALSSEPSICMQLCIFFADQSRKQKS